MTPLAKVRLARVVKVTLDLPAVDVALLDVLATARERTREQTVADALHYLFAGRLPRRDDCTCAIPSKPPAEHHPDCPMRRRAGR